MEAHDLNVSFSAPVRRSRCQGQSLIELALALPLLVIILVGALDLGRAFFSVIVITNASREGARYATWHQDSTAIKNRTITEALNSGVTITNSQVIIDPICNAGCELMQPVTVTVNYQFEPILGLFLGNSIPFSRSTEMMMVVKQP